MAEIGLASMRELMRRAFIAVGTPDGDASLVADEIAMANRLGVHSHGVLRFPQYIRDVRDGLIIPGAEIRTLERTSTTAILDCGHNFGQVGAFAALRVALEMAADSRIACVVTRRSNHVGRVGAYVEAAARSGFVCVALVTTSPRSHMVAPFGGREGRLGTNPIGFAAPTLDEPIVADFATSVFSEGKIRIAARTGSRLSEAATIDSDGRVSDDPRTFYGAMRGALLPLGGGAGYKGMALGILAEILAGQLAGEEATDAKRPANGLFLLVIDPGAFIATNDFQSRVGRLRDYIRTSTAAGSDPVLVPGDREARHVAAMIQSNEMMSIDDVTWQEIEDIRIQLNIEPGPS